MALHRARAVGAALAILLALSASSAEELGPARAATVARPRSSSSSKLVRASSSAPRPRLAAGKAGKAAPPSLAAAKAAPPSLAAAKATPAAKAPSFYWALLHNWLYFLSLGFNAINMAFLVREIVSGGKVATPESIALSGHVETVDKLLTFLGVAYLAALSDVRGRRPLMAWSALGFAATNLIQATTVSGASRLYLADVIDGMSSCMQPVCQAYVTDCSPPEKRASNLGVFSGLSIGGVRAPRARACTWTRHTWTRTWTCPMDMHMYTRILSRAWHARAGAFIIAFPVGGILGAKLGPRVPLLIAAALQLLNFLLITFVTPE